MRDLIAELNAVNLRLEQEIDQRRQAQRQLRECRERLSIANSVMHDVNNLLLVMHFSSTELLAGLADDDPRRPAVAIVDEARKQIAELTRQFRDSNHSDPPEPLAVDLNELVAQWEQLFRQIIKNNTIMTVVTSTFPALINVNPEKVERILLHLVLNALGAIPEGGWITLETNHVYVANAGRNTKETKALVQCVQLCISDTGFLDDAAEPEERLPNESSRKWGVTTAQGHSGIRALVEELGGWVEVKTSIETGTRVEIYFPVARQEAVFSTIPAGAPPPDSRHESILLVDDEPLLRRFVKGALQSRGFSVVEAKDGFAAIAAAVECAVTFDLLISDLKLPDMSGYDVAEKLRTLFPNLPVIFMSGLIIEEQVPRGFSRDTISFLQKPFQTSDLLLKVQDALDSKIRAS